MSQNCKMIAEMESKLENAEAGSASPGEALLAAEIGFEQVPEIQYA